MRLLADENIEGTTVDVLRGAGLSVYWLQELRAKARVATTRGSAERRRRWLDAAIWRYSVAHQAAILTYDHGFEVDAHERLHHFGLIRLDLPPWDAADRAARTLVAVLQLRRVDLEDRVFVVTSVDVHHGVPHGNRTRRG